jgi:hypothetical protein
VDIKNLFFVRFGELIETLAFLAILPENLLYGTAGSGYRDETVLEVGHSL